MARVSVQVPIDQSETAAEPQNAEPINAANIQPDSNQAAGPVPAEAPIHNRRPALMVGKRLTLVGFVVMVVIVIAFMAVLKDRDHLKQQVKQATTQANTSANDAQKYKEAVDKLVEISSGTTPLANTPSDTELTKLKNENPIYSNVKTGDVFLVYTLNDKSLFLVVYRPATNKVILATAGSQSNSASAGSQTTLPKRQ